MTFPSVVTDYDMSCILRGSICQSTNYFLVGYITFESLFLQLAYVSIALVSDDFGGKFTIDPEFGHVSSKPLDRDTIPSYILVVTARDHGQPVKSSSATVNVIVLDENDNSPIFSPSVSQQQQKLVNTKFTLALIFFFNSKVIHQSILWKKNNKN